MGKKKFTEAEVADIGIDAGGTEDQERERDIAWIQHHSGESKASIRRQIAIAQIKYSDLSEDDQAAATVAVDVLLNGGTPAEARAAVKVVRELGAKQAHAVWTEPEPSTKSTKKGEKMSREVDEIFEAAERQRAAIDELDASTAAALGGDEPRGEIDARTMTVRQPAKAKSRRAGKAETIRVPVVTKPEGNTVRRSDTDGETFRLPVN